MRGFDADTSINESNRGVYQPFVNSDGRVIVGEQNVDTFRTKGIGKRGI